MFPRYGSYPGFNPMVELSMTFHTQVVGSNGQRQAMFIERTPGLAEVILSNFTFGPKRPDDRVLGRRADGRPGRDGPRRAPAWRAGHRGNLRRSNRCPGSRTRSSGGACSTRRISSSISVRHMPTRCARSTAWTPRSARARRSPRSPSSIASRCGPPELLQERGALPPVLTRASVVGAERSREIVRGGLS